MKLENECTDKCILKKQHMDVLVQMPISEIRRNKHYGCFICDGYNCDCPMYTPQEDTP